jgi:hypothetical protein
MEDKEEAGPLSEAMAIEVDEEATISKASSVVIGRACIYMF